MSPSILSRTIAPDDQAQDGAADADQGVEARRDGRRRIGRRSARGARSASGRFWRAGSARRSASRRPAPAAHRLRRAPAARSASARRIALTTRATVISNVFPSVRMTTASSAARSGATSRVESSLSRRRSSSRISATLGRTRARSRAPAPAAAPAPPPMRRGRASGRRREHDRPDVAAGHDDPAAVDEAPLPLEERRPQLTDARVRRDLDVDIRAAHLRGPVDAIDGDVGQPAGAVVEQLDLVDQGDERRCRRRSTSRLIASQVTARYSSPVSQKR